MGRKEKIDKENGIQSHLRFCFLEKNSRHLPEYQGFGWQKINAVKPSPLPVATMDCLLYTVFGSRCVIVNLYKS